jgi:ribosomal protein S18 acetylase RimI-like enzyme
MEKITDLQQYIDALSAFKKAHKSYSTNLFLGLEAMRMLVQAGDAAMQKAPLFLNIIIRHNGFSRLYFYAEAVEHISIPHTADGLVCELFGTEPEVGRQAKVLAQKGLAAYAVYCRYSLKNPDTVQTKQDEACCPDISKDTADRMYDEITKEFDAVSDRIPSRVEFEYFIENKYFVLERDAESDDIAGFMIYDIKGVVSAVEYIVVLKKYRGQGIGGKLLKRYFAQVSSKVKKFELWVNVQNFAAIRLYENFNYKKDQLAKYVLTNRGLCMEKRLLEVLSKVNPEIAEHADSNLIHEGIIDSYDIMHIVSALEVYFEIELDAEDIVAENFETVAAIHKMVAGKVTGNG